VTGTVTNTLTAPISIDSVDVTVLFSGGDGITADDTLYPGGDNPVTVDPGQSIAVSDEGMGPPALPGSQASTGAPTVTWDWPAESPYFNCPSGDG
jgi:hypothetical protein